MQNYRKNSGDEGFSQEGPLLWQFIPTTSLSHLSLYASLSRTSLLSSCFSCSTCVARLVFSFSSRCFWLTRLCRHDWAYPRFFKVRRFCFSRMISSLVMPRRCRLSSRTDMDTSCWSEKRLSARSPRLWCVCWWMLCDFMCVAPWGAQSRCCINWSTLLPCAKSGLWPSSVYCCWWYWCMFGAWNWPTLLYPCSISAWWIWDGCACMKLALKASRTSSGVSSRQWGSACCG